MAVRVAPIETLLAGRTARELSVVEGRPRAMADRTTAGEFILDADHRDSLPRPYGIACPLGVKD